MKYHYVDAAKTYCWVKASKLQHDACSVILVMSSTHMW